MFSSSTKSSTSLPATLAIEASIAYSSNAASAAAAFEDAGLLACLRDARVDHPGGAIEQALDRVGADDHLAELVLDRPERRDRLSELFSLRRISRRLADRAPGASAAHRAELETAEVEHVERDLVALADLAEDVVGRHLDVLKKDRGRRRAVQAHLVLFLPAPDARKRPFDDERREQLAVHFREHDEEVGEAAVGDPHLLAVQHESFRPAAASRRSSRRAHRSPNPVRSNNTRPPSRRP